MFVEAASGTPLPWFIRELLQMTGTNSLRRKSAAHAPFISMVKPVVPDDSCRSRRQEDRHDRRSFAKDDDPLRGMDCRAGGERRDCRGGSAVPIKPTNKTRPIDSCVPVVCPEVGPNGPVAVHNWTSPSLPSFILGCTLKNWSSTL